MLNDSNQAEFAGYVKGSPTRWRWAVGTGTPISSTPRSTYSLRPAVQGLPHAERRRSRQKGDLRKEPPGGVEVEPDDHGLGRARGGPTTKVHPAVEQGQKPMSMDHGRAARDE
ncbi:hypothetical protein [Streptomyces nojiriensis]|uniref:hypothetical protein n=1 Tax=Streptomyces nojiriensis TaxID=66374 RepID=UPI0035DE167C